MIRGGAKGCGRLGSNSFGLGCLIQYDDQIDIMYEIEILVSERAEVKSESLTEIREKKEKWLFQTKTSVDISGDISVTCNNGKRGKKQRLTAYDFRQSLARLSVNYQQIRSMENES